MGTGKVTDCVIIVLLILVTGLSYHEGNRREKRGGIWKEDIWSSRLLRRYDVYLGLVSALGLKNSRGALKCRRPNKNNNGVSM